MTHVDSQSGSQALRIAMLSIHSSPIGPLGTRNTGGMSVYVRELSKWLGCNKHRVDIYTYAAGEKREAVLYPNVRLIHLAQDTSRETAKEQLAHHLPQICAALDNYRQVHDLEYDLIHSHYWLSGVVGTMAQSLWHCPHLTMFHTLGMAKNSTGSGEKESQLRIVQERWLADKADHIVVPAHAEQDNLVRQYQADPAKLSIIPCGVDLELFRPMDRTAARRQLGLSPNAPVVLFVGRFAPLKGIDQLLEAVAALESDFPSLQVMVVGGDGPRTRSVKVLEDLMHQLGIGHRVRFEGRIAHDELAPYYNAADLLVLPSYYESFGLVVLEALACGTPVAATAVGAVDTIVREGFNGTVMASPKAHAVARGIARILTRPSALRPTARQIRETVMRYHWPRIAEAVVHTYTKLLKAPHRIPACEVSAARSTFSNS